MSDENNSKKEGKQKIEVINGNGNIDISPVYSHLEIEKPKKKKNKENIIIPEEKKKK